MSRFILCVIFSLVVTAGIAQRNYFVYIQTDGIQPFFIRINDKMHSATASGYIILSKLKDTIYNFSIGFPGNKWPEQKFACKIQAKDHGYLLKNFDEKGWGLFDLQTLTVQMASIVETNSKIGSVANEVNSFTDILSKAADDSTLRHKPSMAKVEKKETKTDDQPVVKKEEAKDPAIKSEENKMEMQPEPVVSKEEVVEEIKQADTGVANKNQLPVEPGQIKENGPVNDTYLRSVVTKKSESSTIEGFGLVFIDEYGDGRKDTIRILIPNTRNLTLPDEGTPKAGKDKDMFLEISSDTTEKKEDIPAGMKANKKNTCRDMASERDFLKLRKNMAGENNDEGMISEAKKYYKSKCFTTEHVKNLSALFLTNSGKYSFFEASYIHITDLKNFASLESEIKDEYFVKRFRNLIRE